MDKGMTHEAGNILEVDYNQLDLDPQLKRVLSNHQLPNLRSLLQLTPMEMLALRGFNERTFAKLLTFLDSHGMMDQLKS